MSKPLPTRLDSAWFAFRATLLRWRRHGVNLHSGPRRWAPNNSNGSASALPLAAESVSALHNGFDADERALVLGKIENLRRAARSVDQVEVPAGATFSFWKQLGAPTAWRGYVAGRELREGCIIPSTGGGLCQLSNALYQAALKAGLEIVERHAHSEIVPGSAAELGQDATVFWNYVDLRLRSTQPFRLEVELDQASLRVRIYAAPQERPVRNGSRIALAAAGKAAPQSCASCGVEACFRRSSVPANSGRSVFLLDAVSPELNRWVGQARKAGDRLLLPLGGGRAAYAWNRAGFAEVHTFPVLALWRALATRRLAHQGAARQLTAQRFRRRLAAAYASALRYDDEHLVVTQELLPFLWQLGVFQGRSFDVLMSGLPLDALQQQLDLAQAANPASTTLADFRADPALLALERAALARARSIVTPHHGVASLFTNAELLPWEAVPSAPQAAGSRIVFPASTLGRKGAYELRAAAKALGLPLTLAGPVLESANFWDGVEVEQADAANWLAQAAVVVLPAWSENRPGRLLAALGAGVPVIATPACGLPPQAGLTLIPAGDVGALGAALQAYARPGSTAAGSPATMGGCERPLSKPC